MRRMRGWLGLGVVVAVAGCATPQMTAVDLAGRAERNMLEAQQNLAGKNVIVRGVVKSTSLAPRSYVSVSGVAWGSGEVKYFETVQKLAVSVLVGCRKST
jgi:hypothetical protein